MRRDALSKIEEVVEHPGAANESPPEMPSEILSDETPASRHIEVTDAHIQALRDKHPKLRTASREILMDIATQYPGLRKDPETLAEESESTN